MGLTKLPQAQASLPGAPISGRCVPPLPACTSLTISEEHQKDSCARCPDSRQGENESHPDKRQADRDHIANMVVPGMGQCAEDQRRDCKMCEFLAGFEPDTSRPAQFSDSAHDVQFAECETCREPYAFNWHCVSCRARWLCGLHCHKQRAVTAQTMGRLAPERASWFRIDGCSCGKVCEWERGALVRHLPSPFGGEK